MNPTSRAATIIIVVFGIVITLVAAFQARERQAKKERTHRTSEVNDFDRWMTLVPQLIQHHAAYDGDSFPNPPVTLMVLAPLTWISPPNAQFVWVCCKFFFAGGVLILALRMAQAAGGKMPPVFLVLVLGTWLWPVLGDMQEGQTNLLMLLPLAGGLYAAQKETKTADLWAGALVALAICIKVTPIIFLIYFLFRRRWRLATTIILGLGLWLLLVPALAFGWRQNLLWLEQWNSVMIVPFLAHARQEYFYGQSVSAFLSRLIRHVPAFISHKHTAHPYSQYVNVLNLPGAASDWLIRGVLVVIGLAGLWWMRRPLRTFSSPRYLLDVGAVAVFMLWASPRTWVPHFVSLIFTLIAVAAVASDMSLPSQFRNRAMAAMGLCAGLMFMTTDVGKVFGRDGHRWLLTIGVSFWGTVLLMAVLFKARWFYEARSTTPVGEGKSWLAATESDT